MSENSLVRCLLLNEKLITALLPMVSAGRCASIFQQKLAKLEQLLQCIPQEDKTLLAQWNDKVTDLWMQFSFCQNIKKDMKSSTISILESSASAVSTKSISQLVELPAKKDTNESPLSNNMYCNEEGISKEQSNQQIASFFDNENKENMTPVESMEIGIELPGGAPFLRQSGNDKKKRPNDEKVAAKVTQELIIIEESIQRLLLAQAVPLGTLQRQIKKLQCILNGIPKRFSELRNKWSGKVATHLSELSSEKLKQQYQNQGGFTENSTLNLSICAKLDKAFSHFDKIHSHYELQSLYELTAKAFILAKPFPQLMASFYEIVFSKLPPKLQSKVSKKLNKSKCLIDLLSFISFEVQATKQKKGPFSLCFGCFQYGHYMKDCNNDKITQNQLLESL